MWDCMCEVPSLLQVGIVGLSVLVDVVVVGIVGVDIDVVQS